MLNPRYPFIFGDLNTPFITGNLGPILCPEGSSRRIAGTKWWPQANQTKKMVTYRALLQTPPSKQNWGNVSTLESQEIVQILWTTCPVWSWLCQKCVFEIGQPFISPIIFGIDCSSGNSFPIQYPQKKIKYIYIYIYMYHLFTIYGVLKVEVHFSFEKLTFSGTCLDWLGVHQCSLEMKSFWETWLTTEPRKKKNGSLLSIESWLVNRFNRDPYSGFITFPIQLGSIIPYITQPSRFFFIAHLTILPIGFNPSATVNTRIIIF